MRYNAARLTCDLSQAVTSFNVTSMPLDYVTNLGENVFLGRSNYTEQCGRLTALIFQELILRPNTERVRLREQQPSVDYSRLFVC